MSTFGTLIHFADDVLFYFNNIFNAERVFSVQYYYS